MKKVFLIIILLAGTALAALTYDSDYYSKHTTYVGSGNKLLDAVYLNMNEVEGYLEAMTLESGSTITFSNGLTIDNATNNVLELNENSDELKLTFGSNTVTMSSTDVTTFSFGTIVVDLDKFKSNATTFTLPTGDSTGTQYLCSDGAGTLSWGTPSATFTGGNITSDCTLSNGVDLMSTTTDGQAATIKVYDNDTGPAYTNVLSWTNGNVPAIAVGSDTSTFALNSTTIDITAGAVTGVTTLDTSGAVTVGGALSANSWTIGSGAFSTTGATTLGDGTSTVAISSTGIDISTAGAVSNVTTLGMSGNLTNSGGDVILANGKGVKGSTTTAETVGVYGYDTDGAYVGALVITNSATPATVLGNANGTTAITSSDWAVSTAGAMTGIGAVSMDGALSISNASPTINIKDSDATAGDNNITIVGAATDTGDGSEDVDLTISQQIAGTARAVATFDADGNITLGYGTQDVIATSDITVTGSDLTLGTAGVKFTGDGDGAVTLLGLGNGEDEDLTINLDDTADTIVASSSTGVTKLTLTGIGIDTDKVDVTAASPQVVFKDTDAAAGDDNAYITVAATDTGDGSEDIDVTFYQQVAGNPVAFLTANADGALTLDSGTGITMTDTVTFSGGQTRKVRFDPKEVALDGTTPPTLGAVGTDGQCNVSALKFDADGGATGDDIAYISWLVPDGYVVDSARLNVCYTFSAAEDAADEAQFDFTVNAVAAGETIDAAGTALANQTTVIADASTDNGKLHITQYNIEVEDIAVDDLVTVQILVDENVSALAASGTLDVLYLEIEYESTE